MKQYTILKEAFLKSKSNAFFDVCTVMLEFIISIFIVAPLIGIIGNSLGIPWGNTLVIIVVSVSCVATFYMKKFQWFQIESWLEFTLLFGIIVFAGMLYVFYAPILEIRQDPSVYTLKAMNLINDGYTYKAYPIVNELINEGVLEISQSYAGIQNGTMFTELGLETDFYAGSAYFMAFFGFFNKKITFFSQTVIMLVNTALLFFILKKIAIKASYVSRFFMVASFIVAPIIVYFGRGGFCEPGAMVYILLLAYLLLEDRDQDYWVLAVIFLSCYTSRIDYLLIGLIGVLVIAYKNKIVALIYTLASMGIYLLMKQEAYIYYDRITSNDMGVLKYGILFLIIAIVCSWVIVTWGQEIVDKIFYSKIFKGVLIVLGIGISLLMFYDNVLRSSNYDMQIIHEQYIMTYKEFIWDLLFEVFPSIVLIGGILNYSNFINKKKISFLASGFLIVSLTIYLYLFWGAGNSPQLYWMLRRYYNVIIPVLFLAFVLILDEMNKKTGIILSGVVFLLSCNLFANSKQVPDYYGLDKSVGVMAEALEETYDLIMYDEDIRYEISSLLSYADIEIIPVDSSEIEMVLNSEMAENIRIGYVSNMNFMETSDVYQVQYYKMGETYGEVPTERYYMEYNFYVYSSEELEQYIENQNDYIYPNLGDVEVEGIYSDGWTEEVMSISNLDNIIGNNIELVVDLQSFDQTYIEDYLLEVQVVLNETIVIDAEKIEGETIVYNLTSHEGMEIENIKIMSETYQPSLVSDSLDERELGIPIQMIYLTN